MIEMWNNELESPKMAPVRCGSGSDMSKGNDHYS